MSNEEPRCVIDSTGNWSLTSNMTVCDEALFSGEFINDGNLRISDCSATSGNATLTEFTSSGGMWVDEDSDASFYYSRILYVKLCR